MHVHRFPLKCDYYFALNPGERHSGVCSLYEGDEDAPVITGEISPEVFIAGLSPTIKTKGGGGGSRGGGEPRTPKEGPKNSTLLKHIIKAGIYDEQPFDKTYINSKYNCSKCSEGYNLYYSQFYDSIICQKINDTRLEENSFSNEIYNKIKDKVIAINGICGKDYLYTPDGIS